MKKLLVATLAMGMLAALLTAAFAPAPAVAWTNAHCKKNNATTDDNIGGSSAARRSVMNHEIGHAMGIDHAGGSGCNGQPIMYRTSARYFTCGHIKPQADDVNGINAIY